MNSFIRNSSLSLLLLFDVLGCKTSARSSTRPSESIAAGKVTHVVICWLKEPGNADARERLANASKTFSHIPGVISVKAGAPLPSVRPVVDTTYDLAVVITFDSSESLARYDSHPIHLDAVKNVLRPLVAKFVIYDFENTLPPGN